MGRRGGRASGGTWLLPSYFRSLVGVSLIVPIWMLFLPAGCFTVWLWRRDRRPPKGHCQACGYNLTGNTSGICPECGEPATTG